MSESVDLFVIGGGSGGVRAARFAADYGASVALAESRQLGGTCVNVGCVPKKFLVYGAHFREDFHVAESYGWSQSKPHFDWPTLIENKNREIERLNGIYQKLLDGSGVNVIEGHARITGPNSVEVEGQQFNAKHILIATGGWPQIPDIPGREYAITSNEAFFLDHLPERVIVVGGGYIAVEFASIFNGLGARTTQLYRGDLFLRGFDKSVREHLREELTGKGIELKFNSNIASICPSEDGALEARLQDGSRIEADCVFYATGRRPMLDGLGLEEAGVELDHRGYIAVGEQFETNIPSISAIGDVIGRVQLTPVALAEGMAIARRLFKPELYAAADYQNIPTAVFSLPNIGTVGLSEDDAIKAGRKVKIFESRFRHMKLTLTNQSEKTLMKLVVDSASDRVLGCHMVGPDAGETIQGMAIAIRAGATKVDFDRTIGIHPTAAEEFVTMRNVTREA